MTARSIIIGVLFALLIPTVGYFSDQVLRLTIFVGSEFPIVVFAPLVLATMLGALLAWRWRLKGAELAVILTMALAACNITGTGFLRWWSRSIAMPIHVNESNTAWREAGALRRVPPILLPNGGQYDQEFMARFIGGNGERGGLEAVPWDKWIGPISFWVPLALLLGLASICLGLIVYRQWAQRERLRFPIAEFASTLLESQGGQKGRSIFRDGMFWLGLLVLLGIHVNNGLATWWPSTFVRVPMGFQGIDLRPVAAKLPSLTEHWLSGMIFGVMIWPMVIAFGFLAAADVSLSLGLSQVAWAILTAWLVALGIDVHGSTEDLGAATFWQRAGSFLAVAAMILYTGRRYYWNVLRQALAWGGADDVSPGAAWACRLFIVCVIAMVAMLCWVGLPWPMAVLLVALLMLLYLIQARINTESGLILSLPTWVPSGVMIGLFGAKALGPSAFAIAAVIGAVFARDAHECLMPFVLNAMRVSHRQGLEPKRSGWLAAGGFAIALAAGVPFALWVDHTRGVERGERHATWGAPPWAYNAMTTVVDGLKQKGELKESEDLSAWQRLAGIRPSAKFLWAAGVGIALVLIASALRLRYTWWPVHPILFLVWGTWAMGVLAYSFLIGWGIRSVVTKLGGAHAYRRARVVMIGVIAGELLGGLLWMIVGAIYYAYTGHRPMVNGQFVRYMIFPSGG